MIVKILGTGCPKCNKLEEKVRSVIESNSVDASVEKVTNINEMMKYDILITPGLVINERLVASGKLPGDEEILAWLKAEENS
jgi:small redox-active disulfide protein 2